MDDSPHILISTQRKWIALLSDVLKIGKQESGKEMNEFPF